jgi:hypothetical protein
MTVENSKSAMLPFSVRFAEPIIQLDARPIRYDANRQISEVLVNGRWIDAPDAPAVDLPVSRLTRVARETTDDA